MAEKKSDDLIAIKKHEKKEKAPKQKKEKVKKPKSPKKEKVKAEKKKQSQKVNASPRANGVKLDFTEQIPRINRYYIGISKKYRAAKVISVVLLACFLLFMLVFYRDSITYENLVYLARDLDTDVTAGALTYNNLSYDESYEADFEIFRNRIAVAKNTGFTLYSRAGGVDLSYDSTVAEPMLCTSDQYALMYDAGGGEYSLYTAIGQVHSDKTSYEIEDACISDSGTFALLTRNNSSRFLVTVYSEDFRELGWYHKDKLVMDMSIDRNGEYLAMASADVKSTGISTQISMGKIGTKEMVSLEYEGMMPVACEYTESGKLFVLCDSALLVFDNEKETARVDFAGFTPGMFHVDGDIIAISFAKNVSGTQSDLKVFDTAGKEMYNTKINGKIVEVRTDGSDAVYCVCETSAVRLSLGNGKTEIQEINEKVIDALAVPGSLIICTPESTVGLFTDN